jgi:hypothetical protein
MWGRAMSLIPAILLHDAQEELSLQSHVAEETERG